MNKINNSILELSPSLKDRLIKSIAALIGLVLGVILVTAVFVIELQNTMISFIVVFIGALLILFTLLRLLKILTTRLYVDDEEIHYRDNFVWKTINWSEIISVGRKNEIETHNHENVLKRIKALLFLTKNGIREFKMSTYSLTNGIETVRKVIEAKPVDESPKEEKEKEDSEFEYYPEEIDEATE
jgi:hypothetical protein